MISKLSTVLVAALILWVNASTANAQTCDRSDALKSQVVTFMNDVSHTTRPNIVQRYGVDVIERYDGPVTVSATELRPHDAAIFVYAEMESAVASESTLRIKLSDTAPSSIGLVLTTPDQTYLFASSKAEALQGMVGSLSQDGRIGGSTLPKPLRDALGRRLVVLSLTQNACGLEADLPDEITSITGWGLLSTETQERVIAVSDAGIYNPVRQVPDILTGRISSHSGIGPGIVELTYANKEVRHVTPSLDGRFAFKDEFPNVPLRIGYQNDGQESFPLSGRWLGVGRVDHRLDIVETGDFINVDGRLSDSCDSIGRTSGSVRYDINPRPGHFLREWCGSRGAVMEFENTYFVNNLGMHDRDVLWDKDRDCLTVAHFGHSSVEAVQVPLHLKHNILAGELLATKLGQCVRIHTFEGNYSIASQPRIEWVMEALNPDIVIFAMHRQMIQLLTPDLLESIFGYTEGNAHHESLKLNDRGKLIYVPNNPRYALTKTVETKSMAEGYPLGLAYNLPIDVMPEIAREAYDVVEQALGDYKKRWRKSRFAVEFTHTYAECEKANYCVQTATFRDADHDAGAVGYARNMQTVCDRADAICIDGGLPLEIYRGFPDLVFQYDAHYTRKGNRYQAGLIASQIADALDD